MRQNMAYVNLAPIVVDGCNEPGLVPANIENSEPANLIRMRKNRAHLLDIGEAGRFHLREPLDEARSAVRVQLDKFVESFARDDVHR